VAANGGGQTGGKKEGIKIKTATFSIRAHLFDPCHAPIIKYILYSAFGTTATPGGGYHLEPSTVFSPLRPHPCQKPTIPSLSPTPPGHCKV
jgi:hypothetical protein